MLDVLNELTECIYITDVETYDLLYLNRAAQIATGCSNLQGKKCYGVMQHRTEPCEFCHMDKLCEDKLYSWEMKSPTDGRHYLRKDKLVERDGRKCCIALAIDTTEVEEERQLLHHALASENLVTACARRLYDSSDRENAYTDALQLLGDFIGADRALLLKSSRTSFHCLCEWCKPGIAESTEENSGEMTDVLRLYENRAYGVEGEHYIARDVEEYRENFPALCDYMHSKGVHHVLSIPLRLNDKTVGMLVLHNYDEEKIKTSSALWKSLGYFFAAAVRQEEYVAALTRMSYYDSVTGTLNRHGLSRDMHEPHNLPMGAVYLDVNGMKDYNDREGHQGGDALLTDLARTATRIFSHGTVYRVGGDELLVLWEECSQSDFEFTVQMLRNELAEKQSYSAAIGAAWTVSDGNLERLMYRADENMYADKKKFYRNAGAVSRYRPSMDDVLAMSHLDVLQSMIDKGCFEMYYQPQIDIETQRLTGLESLVRCHRNGEMIPPARFIPVLEENRLISVLDFHVFELVCRQLRTWLDAGLQPPPISVNFSRHTISVSNFAERICAVRKQYDVPYKLLEIEVTETSKEDETERFTLMLENLKARGFRIAIDDFGVRHANLAVFTQTEAFDTLKIDKCLLDAVPGSKRANHVVRAVVRLCSHLQIQLVCEGVETQAQIDFLADLHAPLQVQGYFYSRPLTVAALEEQYLSKPPAHV